MSHSAKRENLETTLFYLLWLGVHLDSFALFQTLIQAWRQEDYDQDLKRSGSTALQEVARGLLELFQALSVGKTGRHDWST